MESIWVHRHFNGPRELCIEGAAAIHEVHVVGCRAVPRKAIEWDVKELPADTEAVEIICPGQTPWEQNDEYPFASFQEYCNSVYPNGDAIKIHNCAKKAGYRMPQLPQPEVK